MLLGSKSITKKNSARSRKKALFAKSQMVVKRKSYCLKDTKSIGSRWISKCSNTFVTMLSYVLL